MARLLDVSAGPVNYGYYYSKSFEEVTYYIQQLLDLNESFLCTVHTSALFTNAAGEEQELHMSALQPVLFDPEDPPVVFEDKIQNLWEDLTNPEAYENIEGSGWTLIPGTFTYWVNTILYQPNNDPHPSERSAFSPAPGSDPDDPPVTDDIIPVLTDTFLLSLAAHFVPKRRHHTRLMYTRLCQDWVQAQGLMPGDTSRGSKITPSSLGEWHQNVYKYNIRVFGSHGNVIYHWFPPEDTSEYIDLLWNNNKFSYITNLFALLKEKRDRHFCMACKKFHAHQELCKNSIKPARSEKVYFPEFPQGRHCMVVYADFESYIKQGEHYPSGYYLLAIVDGLPFANICCNMTISDEIAEHFIKSLITICDRFTKTSDTKRSEVCGICGSPVVEAGIYARNYINGVYAKNHNDCWDDHRNCAFVFFHNFRGYDSHYILREVMKHTDVRTLRGKSFEKFDLISCVSVNSRFTFKDTFNFFPQSLANLVKNVTNWRYTPPDARHSKGIFPYDWFDNPRKLFDTCLPPPSAWYNKLTNTLVDPEPAYALFANKDMLSFADYHNYYMRIDVTQLADVFEEFRDTVLSEFSLDPVYLQGAPSLTWQLCLQQNPTEMKVITDPHIYLDIQSSIRGGISQVMTRYCNVNTRGGDILYLDINSLYSACMEDSLPTKLVSQVDELPANWEQLAKSDNPHTGLFCVDLYYPEHLHDKHRFYPLAPHKFNNRLCATFEDREMYLCHARNLKFYLDNGMLLGKFYYGYIFEQKKVLQKYVQSNIIKRQEASGRNDKVGIQLYKLLNNSLYGKTCENKFKYRKYSVKDPFVGIWGKRNPFMFKSRNWLEVDNKILCEEDNSSITLDKPIQIGFTVLEFAKLRIYDFYYTMMKFFPEVELLYTDTDSLMMWFPYKEPQKHIIDSPLAFKLDFEKTPDWFNVRTIQTDKVSGLWSLEADKRIVEFVGLRAKTYAIKFEDGSTTLKNKGIVRSAEEAEEHRPLEFEDYTKCLFEDKQIYVDQMLIRSKMHNVSTIKQRKLALSSYDAKRVVLADKVTTLPYGYKGEMFKDDSTIKPSADNL